MKFSYTVLEGGVGLVTYLNKVYDWFEERLEIQAIADDITSGFKKPRELTWVTGVVLAVLTASFGVTGYSLPWDQIGYWAVKIVTGVPEAIPIENWICHIRIHDQRCLRIQSTRLAVLEPLIKASIS
ncbi:Cytochrome b6 [Zea mays]|uniref:Cytochrome b6 n=1 Tax=Zea mays TaxID=4577 RepID=A0A3L6F3W7_MAIZE|nr:Cytochrome b6 [Zea mays]